MKRILYTDIEVIAVVDSTGTVTFTAAGVFAIEDTLENALLMLQARGIDCTLLNAKIENLPSED